MINESCIGNPLVIARKEKDLSRSELAIKLGVAYASVAAVELGHSKRLPATWKGPLEVCGFSFDELSEGYDLWRREIAAPNASKS